MEHTRSRSLIAALPNWLRWLAFLPVAMAAGYFVDGAIYSAYEAGGLSSHGVAGYLAAFLSGISHALVTLWLAQTIAPAFQRVVLAVLCLFLVMDLATAHLILPLLENDLSAAEGTPASIILNALRASDYGDLVYGGLVKVAGAAIGAAILLVNAFSRKVE